MNAKRRGTGPRSAKLVIVRPARPEYLEERAAEELSQYVRMMVGASPVEVVDTEVADLLSGKTFFLIGSDRRNRFSRRLLKDGHLQVLRRMPDHRDAFVICGEEVSGAEVLLLAGLNPIGTLYSVYEYLETGCRVGFFQDGEHVPRSKRLPIVGLESVKRPRFDNRLHFAWNAHRAIKKYHSFWWTLEDWKREFDWMVKRRMNMVRLDMGYYSRFAGDAFEQAFPEIGPEPEETMYRRFAGWIVGWGWPPKYRRKLTQQLLQYGRKLGIRFIYSLSYGTVAFRFKDKHPEYKYLPGNQYGESRQISPYDANGYKVERKHLSKIIELFATDHLYMYTPYAEIDVGEGSMDRNLTMRIKAGKRIRKLIKDVDPQGVWVTDTWDMACSTRWNASVVRKYLDSFPTGGMYVYDTAAEIMPLYRKYGWWHGKKWAFGVIHCFAGKETLHGNPRQLIRRAREASSCRTCTGLFMIPESTHHNVMFWDLTTHLAWSPDVIQFDDYLREYVARRYGTELLEPMCEAWRKIARVVYGPVGRGLIGHVYLKHPWYQWPEDCPLFGEVKPGFLRQMESVKKELHLLGEALGILLKYRRRQRDNPVYVEDVIVVFRTFVEKYFHLEAGKAYLAFKDGAKKAFQKRRDRAINVPSLLADVLSACPSYSINRTISDACRVRGHNRHLPEMIRQACINVGYVNNDVYEQFHGQYIPRTQAYFDLLSDKLARGDRTITRKDLKAEFQAVDENYRKKGWKGKKSVSSDPVGRVTRHFKTLLVSFRSEPLS